MATVVEEIRAGDEIHRRLAYYHLGTSDFYPRNGHEEWALDVASNPDLNPVLKIEFRGHEPFLKITVSTGVADNNESSNVTTEV
jgi:hypothetical protein